MTSLVSRASGTGTTGKNLIDTSNWPAKVGSSTMICGLRQLDGLRSVVIENTLWSINLNFKEKETLNTATLLAKFSGSPLTRSWNPLHPGAEYWVRKHDQHMKDCQHVFTMTRALSASRREISNFKVDDELPADEMAMSLAIEILWNAALNAYSRLEALDITITGPFHDESNSEETQAAPTPMLPALLTHMPHLKMLKISLFHASSLEDYSCDRVFPYDVIWPNSTRLEIPGLATRGIRLLHHLIGPQCPRLQHLCLATPILLADKWESVIEGLRRRGLRRLKLKRGLRYRHISVFGSQRNHGSKLANTSMRTTANATWYMAVTILVYLSIIKTLRRPHPTTRKGFRKKLLRRECPMYGPADIRHRSIHIETMAFLSTYLV